MQPILSPHTYLDVANYYYTQSAFGIWNTKVPLDIITDTEHCNILTYMRAATTKDAMQATFAFICCAKSVHKTLVGPDMVRFMLRKPKYI